MPTKTQPKTREQKQAERLAEIDVFQQMEAVHAAEQVASQAEHRAFAARVQSAHDAIDSHIRRSWAQRSDESMTPRQLAATRAEIEQAAFEQVRGEGSVPTLDMIYAEKREAERLEEERLEAERLAAIPARDTLISALPYTKKLAIEKWEGANKGQVFPLEALPYL